MQQWLPKAGHLLASQAAWPASWVYSQGLPACAARSAAPQQPAHLEVVGGGEVVRRLRGVVVREHRWRLQHLLGHVAAVAGLQLQGVHQLGGGQALGIQLQGGGLGGQPGMAPAEGELCRRG
jgi:hypothetical protein